MRLTREIGFLHTAEAHVPTFSLLASEAGVGALHEVRPELLAAARVDPASASVAADVAEALALLVARGADVIVCTCSTLGPVAELAAASLEGGCPVLRVDRPMARVALALAGRQGGAFGAIGVVAALPSAMSTARDLLAEEAALLGGTAGLMEVCIPRAWTAFEAGDQAGYLGQIAVAALAVSGQVRVVVLAQASMAGAVDLLPDLGVPVLSSPALAVAAAVDLAG